MYIPFTEWQAAVMLIIAVVVVVPVRNIYMNEECGANLELVLAVGSFKMDNDEEVPMSSSSLLRSVNSVAFLRPSSLPFDSNACIRLFIFMHRCISSSFGISSADAPPEKN